MRGVLRSMRWLLVLILLTACSPPPPEIDIPLAHGIRRGDVYHYEPLGWRFPMPSGWRVLTPDEVAQVTGKGRQLIEQSLGEEIDYAERDLLYLKHTARNGFTSSVGEFDSAEGSFEEQHNAAVDIVLAAYENAKIPVRSSRARETIDGVEFELLQISMLERGGTREIGQQQMYSARMGDRVLTVSITTLDLIRRLELLAAWRASRFDRNAWTAAAP